MKPAHSAKHLVRSLRALPVAEPPDDLRQRVMAALPRRRGLPGRMEHAVRSHLGGRAGSLWRPSSPAELGLFVLSAGLFFCCLSAVIWLRLPLSGRHPIMAPTLIAGLMLMVSGGRQIRSPQRIIALRPGLVVVCGLFVLETALGFFHGARPVPGLIAAWLGLSGLIVMAGLTLVLASPLSGRNAPGHLAAPLRPEWRAPRSRS